MQVSSEQQRNQMLTEPIGRLLFKKAAPTGLIQLITGIYNTADTYVVAKIDTGASAAGLRLYHSPKSSVPSLTTYAPTGARFVHPPSAASVE